MLFGTRRAMAGACRSGRDSPVLAGFRLWVFGVRSQNGQRSARRKPKPTTENQLTRPVASWKPWSLRGADGVPNGIRTVP